MLDLRREEGEDLEWLSVGFGHKAQAMAREVAESAGALWGERGLIRWLRGRGHLLLEPQCYLWVLQRRILLFAFQIFFNRGEFQSRSWRKESHWNRAQDVGEPSATKTVFLQIVKWVCLCVCVCGGGCNPNVKNDACSASLISVADNHIYVWNMLYSEGSKMRPYFQGHWGLSPPCFTWSCLCF